VHLLVTTRTRNLGGARFAHVELGSLEPPYDRALIEALAERNPDPGLTALTTHVGGHTLALELAGAFLRTYSTETAESYLRALQLNAARTESSVTDRVAYERTVDEAFQLAWDRLEPPIREAWQRAACFEPEAASRALAEAVGLDAHKLRALENTHLIRSTSDGRWIMHRLTRSFGRRTGSSDELRDAIRDFVRGCAERAREIRAIGMAVYLEDRPHFDAALKLAPGVLTAGVELEFLLYVGPELMIEQGYMAGDTKQLYERASDLARRSGSSEAERDALQIEWTHFVVRGRWRLAERLVERMAELAARAGNTQLNVAEQLATGVTAVHTGRPVDSYRRLHGVIGRIESGERPPMPAMSLASARAHAGLARCLLGYPDQGLELVRESELLASRGDPGLSSLTAMWLACIHQLRSEPEDAARHASRGLEIASQHELLISISVNAVVLGWAQIASPARTHVPAHVLQAMTRALTKAADLELGLGRAMLLGLTADACLRVGQREQGLRFIDQALEWVEQNGDRSFEAELWRVRADLLEPGTLRVAHLDKALEIASAQGARWWALRAAIDLVGASEPEQTEPALRRLRDLYGEFSEGWSLPDLSRARAVLEHAVS
jgi:hypothetical protein